MNQVLAQRPLVSSAADIREVERFLFEEAALLDRRLYDSWLDMFTADGRYWVPAAPDQLDPDTHVSLYYEDRLLMATRIKRLNHPRAYSLDGSSVRTSHLVGNVRIEGEDPGDGAVVVRSAFHMLEYRNEVQRMFGGFYTHRLMPTVAGFRIALKRVDLINCDAAFEALQVFL